MNTKLKINSARYINEGTDERTVFIPLVMSLSCNDLCSDCGFDAAVLTRLYIRPRFMIKSAFLIGSISYNISVGPSDIFHPTGLLTIIIKIFYNPSYVFCKIIPPIPLRIEPS
jgi:hypothetical protein